MKFRIAAVLALALAGSCSAAALKPEFLFAIESMDEDYILGVVGDVTIAGSGEICLLDRQLLDIKIFDSEGRFLRTIGRGGEGPGELSSPGALIELDDGRLLVPCRMPRRLVTMDLEGLPGDELPRPDELKLETGFLSFVGRCGNRLLAMQDERDRDGNHERIVYRWIGFGAQDAEAIVLAESSVERRLGESNFYTEASFPFGRFSAHAQGAVFLATERERYRIQRFDRELQPAGWIELDYPVHHKTKDELREERERMEEWTGGQAGASVPDILETKPSVDRLIARWGGWLFVRSSRASDAARKRGVVGSYDLFDAAGNLVGDFDLDLPFDYDHDQMYWTNRHLVIVRNGLDAWRASQAQYMAEEEREKALSGDWEQRVEFYAIPPEMRPELAPPPGEH